MATITISREYGSGGDEIAARVSEKLGYRYFDRAMLAQIVAETGLSESEIVDFSEDNYKVRSFLEHLFARSSLREINRTNWDEDPTGTRASESAFLNEAQGIALVQSAIRAAYKQGNVVIVGRGGQAILKGLPGVLHVRVQAPLDTRFGHIAAKKNIHLLGLRKEIVDHDLAAADYLKRFYGIAWDDPMLYDVVINTTQLSVEAAAQMIVDAAQSLPTPAPEAEPLGEAAS
jgi:cytidylate kinase